MTVGVVMALHAAAAAVTLTGLSILVTADEEIGPWPLRARAIRGYAVLAVGREFGRDRRLRRIQRRRCHGGPMAR
ncbi:hypothetical protein [Streptomyces sp. NPDC006510]|uniref:hypothetical protein n=1 Tax=Streptomyces sp. NPDC006510 TaxID=3155600 RepID=UPI00339E3102